MNEAMCTAPCIVLDAKNESILMSFFVVRNQFLIEELSLYQVGCRVSNLEVQGGPLLTLFFETLEKQPC